MVKKLTDEELQKKLTPEQYHVLREKGTEAPFTGELLENKNSGMYVCAACGAELFSSDSKFESGSGWPSFYDVARTGSVELKDDSSLGMKRTEVVCTNCGSHLGHLFNDAHDQPTGNRYCINSLSLDFMPKDKAKKTSKSDKKYTRFCPKCGSTNTEMDIGGFEMGTPIGFVCKNCRFSGVGFPEADEKGLEYIQKRISKIKKVKK